MIQIASSYGFVLHLKVSRNQVDPHRLALMGDRAIT